MSLYARYVEERLGRKTIETEYGFMTYFVNGKEFFVSDFYVLPSERGKGHGKEIIEMAFKALAEAECDYATAGVAVQAAEDRKSVV